MNKIHALENEHTHDLNNITTQMRRKSDAQIEVTQRSQVEVERLTKHLQKLEGGPLVILPTVWWMGRWDTVTSAALLFTAIFTPYEVAMLPTQLNTLFFLNRIIDLVFITDMIFCFFLAYRLPSKQGGGLVKELSVIRYNYLTSWFPIDFVSVIPLDFMALGGVEPPFDLKALRLIRLLRLLKLMRVVKASRIFQRFEEKITIPYAIVSLTKFLVVLLVMGHWMACFWVMVAALQDQGDCTWLDALRDRLYAGDDDGACGAGPALLQVDLTPYGFFENPDGTPAPTPSGDATPAPTVVDALRGLDHSQAYAAAIYWAIVTITSVGYGDITPTNKPEMLAATFLLLLGAFLWAWIIGSFCSVLSTLDVETIEHQQLMDQLTELISEHQLEPELKADLRRYFIQRKKLNRASKEQRIMELLPPSLRMRAVRGKCDWLLKVPFFKLANERLLTEIEARLTGHVFPPSEHILWKDALRHLSSGMASRDGRVMCTGAFWGTDCILLNKKLKITSFVNALTYVEMLEISREDLFWCLEDHADERKIVRKYHLKMAVTRGIMYAGAEANQAALALMDAPFSAGPSKARHGTPAADTTMEDGEGALDEIVPGDRRADHATEDELSGALAALRQAEAAVARSTKAVEAALARRARRPAAGSQSQSPYADKGGVRPSRDNHDDEFGPRETADDIILGVGNSLGR